MKNKEQYYEIKVITQNIKAELVSQLNHIFIKDCLITILDFSEDTIWLKTSNQNGTLDNSIIFERLFTRFGLNWKVTRGVIYDDTLQLQYMYTPEGLTSERVILQTLVPFNFPLSEFSKKNK